MPDPSCWPLLLLRVVLPACLPADMNLYNEFLKLATGPHIELFQPRGF